MTTDDAEEEVDQRKARLLAAYEKAVADAWPGSDEGPQEGLDDLVHDAKSREASAINNEGHESQIDYLIEYGCSEEEITEAMKGL